jgi:hypothetical protein
MHILHLSFLFKQDYGYVSNKGLQFQMVGPTRSSPNVFGSSSSGELPLTTTHDAVRGIHRHSNKGVTPDPTDAAAYHPAAEP